jgi:hypothetical protein
VDVAYGSSLLNAYIYLQQALDIFKKQSWGIRLVAAYTWSPGNKTICIGELQSRIRCCGRARQGQRSLDSSVDMLSQATGT